MHYSEVPRHPLGLPPGSVRAILTFQIVGLFWLLLLIPDDRAVPIPLYLYFLLAMVMIFFVSHGKSIAKKADASPSPLWMPGGSIRFLLLAGTAAVIAYIGFSAPDRFSRLDVTPGQLAHWKSYMGALVIGFFVGFAIHVMPFRHSWSYQSFQAWIAILAMLSMVLDMILQAFIKTSLTERIGDGFVVWQTIVTAITAFYFGSRS